MLLASFCCYVIRTSNHSDALEVGRKKKKKKKEQSLSHDCKLTPRHTANTELDNTTRREKKQTKKRIPEATAGELVSVQPRRSDCLSSNLTSQTSVYTYTESFLLLCSKNFDVFRG